MGNPIQAVDFDLFVLDVSASPDAYVAVDGVNQWDTQVNRERQAWPMFMRATDYQTVGSRQVTYSMQGHEILDDPGQMIIRDAEENDDSVTIKVLRDGTNGFTQEVLIGTKSSSVTAGTGLQNMTYEIVAVDDHVLVGSGPGP